MHSTGAASCTSQKLHLQLGAECQELAASWEAGRCLSIYVLPPQFPHACPRGPSPQPRAMHMNLAGLRRLNCCRGWNFHMGSLTRLMLMCRHPSAVGSSSRAAVARMQMCKEACTAASCN